MADANPEWVEAVLKHDGGTCHGFGRLHCFNDPTAKWEGRRCAACHDWAAAVVSAVVPLIQKERDLFWINAILTNDVMVCRIAEGAKEVEGRG